MLCRLHDGLGVEFGELFQGRRFSRFAPSRAVNRVGGGIRHETPLGEYQLLSGEYSKKAFQPMLVRVPKEKQELDILSSHEGEEFLYVVSGPLRFYMEPYSAVHPGNG